MSLNNTNTTDNPLLPPPPPVLPPTPAVPGVPAPPVPSVLRAVSLAKSFKAPGGKLPVLTDISLSIEPGCFASVRGASGAGKTTLLQLLGGLDRPDSGELFWNDERVSRRSNAFLARRRALWLGYVFQSYHLVPELTALENVVLAARIAGRSTREATPAARALLERVGLAERLAHLPGKLSGGECQRVAIARALINKPRIVLADEPTGNLDESTGEEIMELLLNLAKTEGLALILVTHNTAFAARAARRFTLSHGQLHEG
jgi:predicted ABC-type transport system involved in lysophospholipase L1 biosynthesis ATPase subunit